MSNAIFKYIKNIYHILPSTMFPKFFFEPHHIFYINNPTVDHNKNVTFSLLSLYRQTEENDFQ